MSYTIVLPLGKNTNAEIRSLHGVVDQEEDPAVENFKIREAEAPTPGAPFRTYGTLSCGLESMTEAWTGMSHVFSVGARYDSSAGSVYPGNRPPANLLITHPVDLLGVDQGRLIQRPKENRDVSWRFRQGIWIPVYFRELTCSCPP